MQKKWKIPCGAVVCLGLALLWYFRGQEFLNVSRQNLAIRFYNSIVKTCVPQLRLERPNEYKSMYHDAASLLFPAVAYAEDMIFFEGAEDETDYNELFVQENQQIGEMIKENEAVGSQKPESVETVKPGADGAGSGGDGSSGSGGNGIGDGSGNSGDGSGGDASNGGTGGGGSGDGNAGGGSSDGSAGNGQPGGETGETPKPEVTIPAAPGTNSQKLVSYSVEKMKDFDYLRQTFYQIDGTTTIGKNQLNVEKLLSEEMMINESLEGVQILIYHTHSQEGYANSVPGDPSTTVVGVGEYLTQLLTQKYGFRVLHHTGGYDVESRQHAYTKAAPAIEALLKENPNIQVVIDLHRDGVPGTTKLVTELNGTPTAQIMFFNGLSRTTARGELTGLPNPYLDQNLAFSFQMQLAACEYYPGLARRIYLKGYRYNMHFCPKSMLVEVGAQTNTVEEAMNAMVPLADILAKVLRSH